MNLKTTDVSNLMNGVTVHHVRFEVQAREITSFGAQPGSAIRGALYQTLARQYCPDRQAMHLPGHRSACPVCRLLAAEDPTGERGHDLPRPLTIEPPSAHLNVSAGQPWSFALALIGSGALESFPHLVRAVQEMGQTGVGHGRGRFDLTGVETYNPLTSSQVQLRDGKRISMPTLPVSMAQVRQMAESLSPDSLTLRFITPLRIGEQKHLSRKPDFGIFCRRLIERCQAIAAHYGTQPDAAERTTWRDVSLHLSEVATRVRLVSDETRWMDIQSGSQRSGHTTPIGGLIGTVRWDGPLQNAAPWVVWGQSLHVGKDTVKGNGWYEIMKG